MLFGDKYVCMYVLVLVANKTDDKSRKMVDRIPTGGVMSAMQNITAPEEGGELHALSSSSQKTVSSHTQSQPDPASCKIVRQ